MKVLVACEFSGIVRDAFSRKGHNAWSCDILPTESELTKSENKHIQGDVALKWFRDVKEIIGNVEYDCHVNLRKFYYYTEIESLNASDFFDTYEAAESELLTELLTLIENQNEK
jgi:hypothetical protein